MKSTNRIMLMFVVLIISTIQVSGQVKIGDNESTIDAASLLELESTTKGLLTPRMTTTQRDAISNPPKSLIIFNTTMNCLQSNIGDADNPNWECIGLGDADTDSVAIVDGTLNYYRGGDVVSQYPITGVGGSSVTNFSPNNDGDSLVLTLSDGTTFKTPNVSTTCAAAIGSGTQKYIAINTWTNINLNAESYDNTNSLNTSTNKFVVPADGIYQVSSTIQVYTTSHPKTMYFGIGKNGTVTGIYENEVTTAGYNYVRKNVSGTLELKAGDEITPMAYSNIAAYATNLFFSISRIDCGADAVKDTIYSANSPCILSKGNETASGSTSSSVAQSETITLSSSGVLTVHAMMRANSEDYGIYLLVDGSYVGRDVNLNYTSNVGGNAASTSASIPLSAGTHTIALSAHGSSPTGNTYFSRLSWVAIADDCGGSGSAGNGVTNFATDNTGDSLVLTLSDGTTFKTPNVPTSCAGAIATGLASGMSANAVTTLDMSSETYDNLNAMDIANDRFEAPADGIYQVNASIQVYKGSSHPITVDYYISVNGSAKIHSNEVTYNGYVYVRKNIGGLIRLEKGDLVTVQAKSQASSSTGTVNHFSIMRQDCGAEGSSTTSSDTLYPTPVSILTVNTNTTSTNANFDLNTLSGVTVPTGAKYAIIRARGYWAHSGATATSSTGHAHVKLSNDGTNYNTVAYAAGNAGTGRDDTDSDFNDVKVRLRDGKIGYEIIVSGTATLRFGSISLLGFE